MDRIDGKGHHPKIRVKHWTDKIRSKRRKHVIKIVLPATRQLFMLRTETGYSTTKTDRYGYGVGIVADAQLSDANIDLLTTTDVEVGCSDAGTWYVDTKGCCMQQATPSNSPPRHGFVRNLMRYAASVLLIALMAFLAACHKDPTPTPQPNPDQPTDTITPIIPHYPDTVYVPFEFKPAIPGAMPNIDTIKFYSNKPVKAIVMDLAPMDSLYEYGLATGWTWRAFKKVCDTVYNRYYIAPDKIRGRGEIIVPDLLPDSVNYQPGAHESDISALTRLGFTWRKWQH